MPVRYRLALAVSSAAATAMLALCPPALAADAAAAQTLARQSNCMKCHAVDKKKEGPSFQETAAKYKGKAGAEARLTTHITTGEKAKFDDGHEEDHPIVKTKDAAQIKNLIEWILAQ
jgi:cytochrome c